MPLGNVNSAFRESSKKNPGFPQRVIRNHYSYHFFGVLKSNKEKLPGICEKDFDNEKIWGTTARTSY
jgi:hypothetical protein